MEYFLISSQALKSFQKCVLTVKVSIDIFGKSVQVAHNS